MFVEHLCQVKVFVPRIFGFHGRRTSTKTPGVHGQPWLTLTVQLLRYCCYFCVCVRPKEVPVSLSPSLSLSLSLFLLFPDEE